MYFPSATYRVQLNSSYTLSQLKDLVNYLHKLGVSTIYASPITAAMKGSTHGYDVCDPNHINAEIGTEDEFVQLAEVLAQKSMGWLQDIVPNHMAFITGNERVFDVMERGEHSPYYRYFDIDWNHYDPLYKGKLMVPFIGKHLEDAINENEIQIKFDDNGFHVAYFDTLYPLSATALPFIFSLLHEENLHSATNLLLDVVDADLTAWKNAKKEWLSAIKIEENTIETVLLKLNKDKAFLQQVLDLQPYRLTWFAVTESEIDFRRFFTVNQLLCVRMEEENVFSDYHQLILRLYQSGFIQGLRIDHIDGLYKPQQYISRLRETFGENCYLIAEKILEYNEDIAKDWNLQGTSGYEFLSFTNQLLTDKKGAEKLLHFYKDWQSQTLAYADMVFEKKHHFLQSQMGGEWENLLHLIESLSLFAGTNYDRDNLKKALGVLMASFPVYRIYPDKYPLEEEALFVVKKTWAIAEKKIEDAAHELNLLKTVFYADGTAPEDENKLLFLMRLMQFTGPLAAKGVEDTTFYVYNPLISHNEVGDSPSQLGITVEEFHNKMKSRQKNNPYSLSSTSTHDTKRGEDGRMRINAVAAMAEEWIQKVNSWRDMNASLKKTLNGKPAPSANDEYFIYQSLIGAFPEDLKITDSFKERTHAFLDKALREAKVETTYANPHADYEEACHQFVDELLAEQSPFIKSFVPFLKEVLDLSTLYSLAQTVIKITAPGIPDIYQGCELWDISYVDPDNRRPVDYECRKNKLDNIINLEQQSIEAVLSYVKTQKKEAGQKLYVTYKTLNLRRNYNNLFLEGEYLPLPTNNAELMAYARRKENRWIVVVIPFTNTVLEQTDLTVQLPPDAPNGWQNIFTNDTLMSDNIALPVSAMLQAFPVAVLLSQTV